MKPVKFLIAGKHFRNPSGWMNITHDVHMRAFFGVTTDTAFDMLVHTRNKFEKELENG